jgi:hypothetical protein
MRELNNLESLYGIPPGSKRISILFQPDSSIVEFVYDVKTFRAIASFEEVKRWAPLFREKLRVECSGWHEWESYIGFREVYEYCKNCHAKRSAS